MKLSNMFMNFLADEENTPVSFTIPDSLTWVGEYTISIFLRDWLRKFNELNNGVPQEYINMADGDIDLAAKMYKEDIDALADQFDYIKKLCDEQSDIELQPYIDTAFAKLAKLYHYLWW